MKNFIITCFFIVGGLFTGSVYAYDCSGVPQYSDGGNYNTGDIVQNNNHAYHCDVGGWCTIGGPYEPGVGWAWTDAWNDLGTCDGGNSALFNVISVSVSNTLEQAPVKGDTIRLHLTVRNDGTGSGSAVLTPRISSSRFSDFSNVNLPSANVNLGAGQQTQISIDAGPFIHDLSSGEHYALGRSGYTISSIGIDSSNDTSFSGGSFNIGASNAVLVPVLYDSDYLNQINYTQGIQQYMTSAFTRPSELYNGSTYQYHAGGFDQMMSVQQLFYPLSGFSASSSAGGFCEQGTAAARTMLGLEQDWADPVSTNTTNHGFDYLIALTPDLNGGVACSWINVQISGLFDFDLSVNRSQIVMVHETGHLFGAPHCSPLQGYVMCGGELHSHYQQQGLFVWHINSRNQMSNLFD